MKYCKICIQPDTRPNSYLGEDGICPACNYFFKVSSVADWTERYEELGFLLEKYRKKKRIGFDCIIGVSGGKDSTRQALWVRDKLGLNPLLVCLGYPPDQVTQRGVDNISNLINLGFDLVLSNLAPETWRDLVREGFFNFSNWAKSTEQALFSSVPQLAIRYDINLILWGENPSLQLGDMKTIGKTGYDGNNLRNLNTLSGGDVQWMLKSGRPLKELIPYSYPSPKEFDEHNIQIVYLGWFWKDWSLISNGMHSSANGLNIRQDTVGNTGDLWGISSLDEDWVTLNQMIKYYKFGFGRVSDHVNEEIRLGRLTRDEGISLAERYDDACSDKYIEEFCEFIRIPVTTFWEQVRNSTNKALFDIGANKRPQRKFKVGVGI
jgi:N-acetyl sugar amidotransferase